MQASAASSPTRASGAIDNSIKVLVRIRPPDGGTSSSIFPPATPRKAGIRDPNAFEIEANTIAEPKAGLTFTFDHVANQNAPQDEIFTIVGETTIESYLEGYNATVFAYGQTGAGKTFTMQGPGDECNWESDLRGLIPRILKHLFRRLESLKAELSEKVQFSLTCTLLEIYNEQVYDLLVPLSTRCLNVREKKDNTYVEGLVQVPITSAEEAYDVLMTGWTNRRVASTNMNRESSRSHSLFTLYLETKTFKEGGVIHIKTSKLNLIDLAGSERQKDTNAAGERIKEAGSINKSLSAIGNVIQALVDNGQGKKRHVPYRDSTLSFLLRDSLGGNTKTYIIACIHPGTKTAGESISTLRFVSRAKLIKNHAVINEDVEGDRQALQTEIRHLKRLNAELQTGAISACTSSKEAAGGSRSRGHDWRKEFVQAMTLWQKLRDELDNANDQNRALRQDLQRKEKIKLQHKLMMKFREDRIAELEKKVKAGASEDLNNLVMEKEEEIRALNLNMESLFKSEEKQESANIVELKNRIKSLMNDEHLQQKINANVSLAKDLEAKVKQLVDENPGEFFSAKVRSEDGEASAAAAAAATKEIESLKQQVASLKEKMVVKSDEYESFKSETESRTKTLEESLRESRQSCEELTNALKASKLKTQIDMENKNKEYITTIKSMTPRSGRTPIHSRRKIPTFTLNASYLASSPTSDYSLAGTAASGSASSDDTGLEEETLPSAEASAVEDAEEQRQLIESQGKRIEELTLQIQSLEDAKSRLTESSESFSRDATRLAEEKSTLDEKLGALESSQRELQSCFDKLSHQLEEKEEELRIARSEAEDYRVTEAQSWRRLTELKTEYSTIIDGKENQIEEFEEKILSLEKLLQVVTDEKEEALKSLAGRNDDIIRLGDDLILAQTAQRSLETEVDLRKNAEKDLETNAVQLQMDLEKANEKNAQLSQEISSRGDQMEVRLVEAIKLKDEAETRLRTLDDRIEALQTELNGVNSELNSTSALLSQSRQRCNDLNAVLAQVQERTSLLEKDLNSARVEITVFEEREEAIRQQLKEKTASVEQALREADQLDAQLVEMRKALTTQKASYDFDMESLTEDHQCLMDMVDELKAKLATAQQQTAEREGQISDIKANLEAEKRKREELELKSDIESPDRIHTFVKENEDLRSRQAELLRQVEIYEAGRQDRENEITALKKTIENVGEESVQLHQIRARYESLQTELEYARRQSSADADAVLAMTTRLDEADAERRQLVAEYQNLLSLKDDEKTEDCARKEALENEIAELLQQRSVWAKSAEEAARLKDLCNQLSVKEKASNDQIAHWKQEYEKVQKENGLLMGHHNHKQKINHIVALKTQLTAAKQESSKLKMEIVLLKKKYEAPKAKENRPPIQTS